MACMDFNFMAFGMIYCPSKKYQYVEEVDLIQHMAPSTVGGGESVYNIQLLSMAQYLQLATGKRNTD